MLFYYVNIIYNYLLNRQNFDFLLRFAHDQILCTLLAHGVHLFGSRGNIDAFRTLSRPKQNKTDH